MGDTNMTNITSPPSTTTPFLEELKHYTSTFSSSITNETSEVYVDVTEANESSQQVWNVTKAGGTKLPESTVVSFDTSSTSSTSTYIQTTTEAFDEFGPPEGIEYIFVPLGVVVFVIILSAVVIIISRKRKLERLRHRLMPMYNFDPGEEEEDDWETELLEECYNNHQRRQGYQSMDTEENTELFGNH